MPDLDPPTSLSCPNCSAPLPTYYGQCVMCLGCGEVFWISEEEGT